MGRTTKGGWRGAASAARRGAHLYRSPRWGTELLRRRAFSCGKSALHPVLNDMTVSLLCGRLGSLTTTPKRLSSSLLPPSFVSGRRTAGFTSGDTAHCGVPDARFGGAA